MKIIGVVIMCISFMSVNLNAEEALKPVNPEASPEAKQLLKYLYSVRGKKTLTGQHNAPIRGTRRLPVVHRKTGKYPAMVGQDFGFSYPGYWDGINYRQNIVDEAIRRHEQGFINTIMWHAVVPTQDEPVSFEPFIKTEETPHHLTKEEWKELTTDGTDLNERWKSQVDVIAYFLKQLRYADVPILWRPYHEMNGDWFWWGGRPGEDGYKKLYRMLYDRFVNFHKLNNLIWVWNANEVKPTVPSYKDYYPGDDVVDILATDVYFTGFNQENYKKLSKLAGDKLIAIGECGNPPKAKILKEQPKWSWFMKWSEPANEEKDVYNSEQVINFSDLPWVDIDDPKIHYPVLK